MKHIDFCIIGGGIAGTTAAETIRKNDGRGSVCIISEEPYPLYSRVMLSKSHYVLEATDKDKVFLRKREHYTEKDITLLEGVRVEEVDSKEKTIVVSTGERFSYGKLLLAIGGSAKKLPAVVDSQITNVFPLQNLEQTRSIITATRNVSEVVVVGSGFIGFEMASIFANTGKKTTICIRGERFWSSKLSSEASEIVESALQGVGVEIQRACEVKSVHGSGVVSAITLSTNETIPCGLLVYGIGSVYTHEWLKSANIKQKNGIFVNDKLLTSAPDIWAAGDCVEYPEPLYEGKPFMAANWAHAQAQGVYVGESMVLGVKKPFSHVSSYTSSGAGLVLSFIGNTNREYADTTLQRGGRDAYPKFGELFIKGDRLVGAILINRGNEIVPMTKLIQNRIDITSLRQELADDTSNLKTLEL